MNAYTIRWGAVAAVFLLLYGSRLSKGKARQTPAGLEFALKPLVIASYAGALLLYAGFLGYTAYLSPTRLPWWFYAVFVLAIGLILLRLPATIVLGPETITQSYWFLKQRVIGYGEVTNVQSYVAGRAVRVMGSNRVTITHTNNHAAQGQFVAEMERLTAK